MITLEDEDMIPYTESFFTPTIKSKTLLETLCMQKKKYSF